MPDNDHIALKAYELWDQSGRPEGRDHEFWTSAIAALSQHDVQIDPVVAPDGPAQSPPARSFIGHVDVADKARIAGWVLNLEDPLQPPTVVVLDYGVEIARTVALNHRRDLEAAGLGNGCLGYDFTFPETAWISGPHKVELRILEDGSLVPDGDARMADFHNAL